MVVQERDFGELFVRLAAHVRAPGLELVHAHFGDVVEPVVFVPAEQLAHAPHALLVALLQRQVVLLVGLAAVLRVGPLGQVAVFDGQQVVVGGRLAVDHGRGTVAVAAVQ